MSLARAVTADMLGVAVGKALTVVLGLAITAVLARHLGPTGFGHYRTVLTYASLTAALANLGLHLKTLHAISKPDTDIDHAIGNALSVRLITTSTVVTLGAVTALAIPYAPVVHAGLFLAAIFFATTDASHLLLAVFQKFVKQGRAAIAEALGLLVAFMLILWMVRWEAGTLAMIAATTAGAAAGFLVAWRMATRLTRVRLRADWPAWRQLIVSGLPLAGSTLVAMIMLRADTLILSLLRPASEVGLYGVPTKVFEIVASIAYLFGGLLVPLIADAARRDQTMAVERLRHGLDAALVFGIGTAVALAAFPAEIIALIAGQSYVDAAPALMLLGIATAAGTVARVYRFAAIALDVHGRMFRVECMVMAFALCTYFALIPWLSFIGAAIGSAATELVMAISMALMLRLRLGELVLPAAGPRIIAVGLVTFVFIQVMQGTYLPWPVVLLSGGIVYLVLLVATGAIPRSFLRDLTGRHG